MLKQIPDNGLAVTTRAIHDITEDAPVPRGVVVTVEDFFDGLFAIEFNDLIYLASPDELESYYGNRR